MVHHVQNTMQPPQKPEAAIWKEWSLQNTTSEKNLYKKVLKKSPLPYASILNYLSFKLTLL